VKRPVDDEEDEVVVVLDLRPLVEVLRVLDRKWVEPEGLAQDLEVSGLRLVEVEPEEPPAREQLRDLLAAEMHLGAAPIVHDVAGVWRAALRGRSLVFEPVAHKSPRTGRRSANPQPPADRTPDDASPPTPLPPGDRLQRDPLPRSPFHMRRSSSRAGIACWSERSGGSVVRGGADGCLPRARERSSSRWHSWLPAISRRPPGGSRAETRVCWVAAGSCFFLPKLSRRMAGDGCSRPTSGQGACACGRKRRRCADGSCPSRDASTMRCGSP